MRNYKAVDVDSYIAGAEVNARPHLRELRRIIKTTIPKVEEKISWGVPFFRYHGLLAGYSAFKKHVSFGFAFGFKSEDRKALEEKGYKTGSKTVQIGFGQKVPVSEIKKILKEKAKDNEIKNSRR